MTQDTVQQIEESIKASKKRIEMDKALERLESNADFKLLITDGYLQAESVRLVHLKSDPAVQSAEKQAAINAQIDAIGGLLQYFRTVSQLASQSVRAIEADDAEIEELLQEGAHRG